MYLDNLAYIGHCGNFTIVKAKQQDQKPATPTSANLYSDMFGSQGVFAGNKDLATVQHIIDTYLPNEYHVKMITFGLDSIFSAAQASPFSGSLESLGLLKYIKLESATAGIRLPTPISLVPKMQGGRGE